MPRVRGEGEIMTLDEAIDHAREKAECGGECAAEHAQLAEWLEELRELREKRTVYIVETYDELLEFPCVERTCYTRKEDAIRRAESQTYTDEDGLRRWAHWTELKVVGK